MAEPSTAGPDPDGYPAAVLDGYEATRRIKADPALSAHPDHRGDLLRALSGDEEKARAAGCDAYVTKPFSPRELLAKIKRISALSEAERRAQASPHPDRRRQRGEPRHSGDAP